MTDNGLGTHYLHLIGRMGRYALVTACALVAVLAYAVGPVNSACAKDLSMRLAIRWGNGTPRQWTGTINANTGTMRGLMLMGTDADQPGSHWLEPHGLCISQRAPKQFDGVQVSVDSPLDAVLQVRFGAQDGQPSTGAIDVPLADLLNGTFQAKLDDHGNAVSIERLPIDSLRVGLDRDHLVYAPGEKLRFELSPNQLPVEDGTMVDIGLELRNARTQESLWKSEHRITVGAGASTFHEAPLPDIEGVYELAIAASFNPGLNWRQVAQPAWSWRRTLATRRIQCVVIAPTGTDAPVGIDEGLHELECIDPTDPTGWKERWKRWTTLPKNVPSLPDRFTSLPSDWPVDMPDLRGSVARLSERLPKWGSLNASLGSMPEMNEIGSLRGLPGMWQEPTFGNGRLAPFEAPPRGIVQLEANGAAREISWQAYSLPVANPGKPHILEIEYLGRPQTMSVSVLEPNPLGIVAPPHVTFGIDVENPPIELNPPKVLPVERHRMVIWPRTSSPLIVVANQRNDQPALFGKIRLYGGWDHLPRRFPKGGPSGRVAAAYLNNPTFPHDFSAPTSVGQLTRFGVDDWVTYHEGGSRLVEYLHHVGFNGLVMGVWTNGAAVYPSRYVESTALYDSGPFLGERQDPVPKDVVEMLCRMFDREGLQFIPSLDFCAPLPELEAALRRGGPEIDGIRLLQPDGRPCTAEHQVISMDDNRTPGRAPYYNVLDQRVQNAMLNVVRELVARYRHHASFHGLAIRLSPDGYALLPGPDWGLDDTTIATFEQETGVQLPEMQGPDRFTARARYLEANHAEQWLAWRAQRVRAFYARLQEELNALRFDAKLYLAGADLLAGDTTQYQLRPRLPQRMTMRDALLRLGFDASLYDDDRRLVFLSPRTIESDWSLSRSATRLESLRLSDRDKLFTRRETVPGSLMHYASRDVHIETLESKSPFPETHAWFSFHEVPTGLNHARRYVHAFASLDAQVLLVGGDTISTDQTPLPEDFLAAYRHLPLISFDSSTGQSTEDAQGSVTLRYARGADGTYVYVVNDGPTPITAEVRVKAEPGCRIEELSGTRTAPPIAQDARGTHWNVPLQPYELVAVRLSDPSAELYDVRTEVPLVVRQEIERRINEVRERIVASRMPVMPYQGLNNASFETPASSENKIASWKLYAKQGRTFEAETDDTHARQGGRSLRVHADGAGAALVSDAFPCPTTGRLTMMAWIGVPEGHNEPIPMRFAIDDAVQNVSYLQLSHERTPIVTEPIRDNGVRWQRVLVPVSELPIASNRQLRVRFDFQGAADVWIDDVQLYGVSFSRNERIELMRLVGLVNYSLQTGDIGQAVQLLDGYWPRFLMTYVPAPEIAPVEERAQIADTPSSEREEKRGVLSQLKSYIPSSLQFF